MFSFQYEELFHFIFGKMFRSLTNEIWEVETFVWDSTDPQHMILKSTEKLLMKGISAWSLNLSFPCRIQTPKVIQEKLINSFEEKNVSRGSHHISFNLS